MRSSNLPAGSASHALFTCVKMPAYLVLLRMEVTAFHRNLIRSSLWPYSAPYTIARFQRTAVSRHLALCSPDFPPPIAERRLSSQLPDYFNTRRRIPLMLKNLPIHRLTGPHWDKVVSKKWNAFWHAPLILHQSQFSIISW